MRRNRRVKIVATLGPASNNEKTIRALFEAGADVFRINMSHATPEALRESHAIIRKIEAEFSRPIGILIDLQGPKLRIGKFESGAIRLTEGDIVSFVRRESVGGLGRVHLPHPEIFEAVQPGHTLLLDDGKLRLRVVEASDVRIDAEVLTSGTLGSRKGISLPDTVIPLEAMTDKDRVDLEDALTVGVDWVALSFVQRAKDIAEARKLVRGRAADHGQDREAFGACRARGDHRARRRHHGGARRSRRRDAGGEGPGLQKQITRAARNAGKPVVVATQMLESMIVVAGAHPRRGVRRRHRRVRRRRRGDALGRIGGRQISGRGRRHHGPRRHRGRARSRSTRAIIHAQRIDPEATGADAISAAARTVTETLNLAAIICYTASGATSLRAARERPPQPIIALTPIPATGRKLAIVWGLHCVLTGDPKDLDDMVAKACRIAYQEGFASPGSG